VTGLTFPARRPRPIGILAVSVLLAAGSTLAGWSGLGDRTTVPAPGAPETAVSVPIPGAGTGAFPAGSLAQLDHNITAWTRNLEANPNDFISATMLGTLYHARARLTADLADHERALEAARTAIAIAPTQPAARNLEASILFSLHDFRSALASADLLYREDRTQFAALATRADSELELGDLDAARSDLAVLQAATSGPAVDVRLARLAAVTGDLRGSAALARHARDAAVAEGGNTGFYEYALGEYSRIAGDAPAARAGFEAALAVRSSDLGALVGLARVQAFEGDLAGAIATLEAATAIAPAPEAEALLGDLLTVRASDESRPTADRAADLRAAGEAYGTVRLTRTLSALAGSVYDRQLLLFDLDHGTTDPATLDASRASLEARPDAAGHDLVGWALHRLGRDAEALVESRVAVAAGAADARTLFHAGAIAAALGDAAEAIRHLDAARALGPALDPIERAEATSIRLGLVVPPRP